ncbi:MAG TPA: hypothetical protein VF456_00055 [Vicinamibacterales bacterium]
MKQHYAPQVYLRQWCDDSGRLFRYCRVGPPAAPKLRADRKALKEICWEHNLELAVRYAPVAAEPLRACHRRRDWD